MLPRFKSLWMMYLSVLVSITFQTMQLYALECYEGWRYGSRLNTGKVICDHHCGYWVDLHKLQNFHWDLFLETQLEVDQIVPNDEIDVPDESVFRRGCMDDFEDIESPQRISLCKRHNEFFDQAICVCSTDLCNGAGRFTAPRNLIRNGGQRKLHWCYTSSEEVYVECEMNQLCTVEFNVEKLREIKQKHPEEWSRRVFGAAIFYGCTHDPNPLLLDHTKDVCAFSGDVTNQSVWICRCNLNECNQPSSSSVLISSNDLLAFPNLPQYDENRVRCLKSKQVVLRWYDDSFSTLYEETKTVLDEDFGWCEPHEVCTVRIDLIKKKELNQITERETSAVYQGCYNLTLNERSVIVSENGDECRKIDKNSNLTWRCVCTTPLCNWYHHSKLTNTVSRLETKKSFKCYVKQKEAFEVDSDVIDVSGDHFCAVYVNFALMEDQYQGYANQTKLNESAAILEEPLNVNDVSIVYQDFFAKVHLTDSIEVGKTCKFTFTIKENNDSLWVCLCNEPLCNGRGNVIFMPNELRQNKPPQTTTTTDGPNRGVADKKKAQFFWIILVAKILSEM